MEITHDILYDMYVTKKMVAKDIAAHFGYKSPETIYAAMRKHGIKTRQNREAQMPFNMSFEQLDKHYNKEQLNIRDIAIKYGVTDETIRRLMVRYDIQRRVKTINFGGHNKGVPLSDEQKRKISQKRKDGFVSGEITHWNSGKKTPEDVRVRISGGLLKGRNPAPKTYGQDWIIQRTSRLQHDNYTCQQCGCKHDLEVHHWEPYRFSYDNSLENLVTLCAECHRGLHTDYKKEGFIKEAEASFYG